MGVLLLLSFSLANLLYPSFAQGQCDGAYLEEMNQCLANLQAPLDMSSGHVKNNDLKAYCNGQFEENIRCVEDIVASCERGPESMRQVINKTVNIVRLKQAIQFICKNTEDLVAKEDCVKQYRKDVSKCTTTMYQDFLAETSPVKANISNSAHKWVDDQLTKALCGEVQKVTVCHQRYRNECGKIVADIYDAIFSVNLPPVCHANASITFSFQTASTDTSASSSVQTGNTDTSTSSSVQTGNTDTSTSFSARISTFINTPGLTLLLFLFHSVF